MCSGYVNPTQSFLQPDVPQLGLAKYIHIFHWEFLKLKKKNRSILPHPYLLLILDLQVKQISIPLDVSFNIYLHISK